MSEVKNWFNSLSVKRKNEIYYATKITYNSCAIEGSSLSENETFNLIVRHLFQEENEN